MLSSILAVLPLLFSVSFAAVLPDLLQHNAERSLSSRAVAPTLSLANSQWIWTGEEGSAGGSVPIGSRPFRKTLCPTKCPVCATILISADNAYDLYVNGVYIGEGQDFSTSQVYTVALKESGDNVFAVNATNTGGPAGIIATILVEYTDGTTETVLTDSSWKTLQSTTPSGFQNPATDDSSWIPASLEGADGVAPWGQTRIPPFLDLTKADWIWTNELVAGIAPIGARAFRKTIAAPCDKKAVCAKVVITADNEYTLYVNGAIIGNGTDFTRAQAYSIIELSPDENVFAVNGVNVPPGGPAGLIAIISISYSDGTTETFVTDNTWKAFTNVPAGFQEPGYNDGAWPAATVIGPYGILPWGNVAIPPA